MAAHFRCSLLPSVRSKKWNNEKFRKSLTASLLASERNAQSLGCIFQTPGHYPDPVTSSPLLLQGRAASPGKSLPKAWQPLQTKRGNILGNHSANKARELGLCGQDQGCVTNRPRTSYFLSPCLSSFLHQLRPTSGSNPNTGLWDENR